MNVLYKWILKWKLQLVFRKASYAGIEIRQNGFHDSFVLWIHCISVKWDFFTISICELQSNPVFTQVEQNYINLIIQSYTYEIPFDPFCNGASNSSQQQVVTKDKK